MSRPLTRCASAWIELAVSQGSKYDRRRALAHWLMANDLWKPSVAHRTARYTSPLYPREDVQREADRAVELIRAAKLDPYDSVNQAIDSLREQNKSTSTMIGMRCLVLGFLRYSRLGLDPDDIAVSVRKIKRVYDQGTKLPTRDEVRGLLIAAGLKTKVLISMLISTGARLGEIRRVKVADVDLSKIPAYLYLNKTKTGTARVAFLSSETVMLLKQYLQCRTFDHHHVFDGHDPRVKKHYRFTRDKPLGSTSAWLGIRRAFSQLQMDQRYDNLRYFYHPQVFRVLCLALLKAGGYPSDWAEYLVGHSVGTHTHYLPPTEVLAREWLKLEDRFCFLTEPLPSPQESRNPPFLGTPTRLQPTADTRSLNLTEDPERVAMKFQTHRWSSQAWNYMKTNVRSVDYDEGLAQGYVIFDHDENGLRVLRKRRSPIGNNA